MLFSTYNIHYGVGADGKYDITRIADAVAEADIICIQETVRGWPENGYADQTAEIGRRLNRYFRFHGPMEADASTVDADGRITNRRRSFGNAIVSRWPILWSRGVMLPKMRLMDGLRPAARLYRGRHRRPVGAAQGLLHAFESRRTAAAPAPGGGAGRGREARGLGGRHLGRHGVRQFHVAGGGTCGAGFGHRGRRFQLHAGRIRSMPT